MDLLRLLTVYSPIPAQKIDDNGNLIQFINVTSGLGSWPKDNLPTKEPEANLILGLKILANLFETKEGRDLIRHETDLVNNLIEISQHYYNFKTNISLCLKIFESIPVAWKNGLNKNFRIAFITVLLK